MITSGAVEALARQLRALPVPVIGRIEAGRVILDLRCLEDEAGFMGQLPMLKAGRMAPHPVPLPASEARGRSRTGGS